VSLAASHGIDRKAPAQRTALDATSWVDVVRGFATEPVGLFEALHEGVSWHQNASIREGRKVADPRLAAGLSVAQCDRIPALRRARLVLEARYRIRVGGLGLNLYRDGRDGMGLHRDDEMLYLEKTIVAGLCLGDRRPVVLRCVREPEKQHVFTLGEGDLYVMGGRCQADWLHGVPKMKDVGPRISAVWRWSARVGPPSSSPTHFVPDAPKKRRPQ